MNAETALTVRVATFSRLSYLPIYVAAERRFDAWHGLRLELIDYQGPWSKMLAHVAARDFDVIMGNIWFVLRTRSGPDRAVVIAHCAQQCRNVLVSRHSPGRAPFVWSDLKGKVVILPNQLPTPWIAFHEVLIRVGVTLEDIRLLAGYTVEDALDELNGGLADYVLVDVDTAQNASLDEVAALADRLGPIPWSVLCTSEALSRKEAERLSAFRQTIGAGLEWLAGATIEQIDEIARKFIPGLGREMRLRSIRRYKELNMWPDGPAIPMEQAERWHDVLVRSGALVGPVQLDEALAFDGR